MDGNADPSDLVAGVRGIVCRAHVHHGHPDPVGALADALGSGPFARVVLFVTPETPLDAVLAQAGARFGQDSVVGCTTAGEIGTAGYTDGEIVALAFPRHSFAAATLVVEPLDAIDGQDLVDRVILMRSTLAAAAPDFENEFLFLMIDGLSLREDELTSRLAAGLGPVPLFGGSAADGTRFERTRVLADGRARENAAVLTLFRTRCPVRVFKTDHLAPSETRMVVTSADPARRLVHEINSEPAAREYARILGKDPDQLTPFTFAAHPVVVRIGGQHHVRAIQRVTEDGDLIFFSAIDEGLVLTLAEAEDIVSHLDRELSALSERGAPDTIVACDCILRRLEAQEKQMTRPISAILARNRVVGFSTYGEQINSMHVNQTLTAVAIYPPEGE